MNPNTTLSRFLSAQQNIYQQVIKELQNGKKTTHWMWFVFPQIDGLGLSPTAKYYSIKSIDEAKDYLSNNVLGKRLIECSMILLNLKDKSAHEIFGYPDDMKLNSSMTLFNYIAPEQKVFANVLEKYFEGNPDQRTLNILNPVNGP